MQGLSLITNLPISKDRVTDHRIGRTIKNLTSVLEGDVLEVFIDALQQDFQEGMMESILGSGES